MTGEPIRPQPRPTPKERTRFGAQRKSRDPRPARRADAKAAHDASPAPLAFPKPVKREREPKRLKAVSDRRLALIAAGEARAGMKRSFMRPKPPRRLETEDAGRMQFARESMCVVRELPGHICVGRMQASHERNPQGGPPTGGGRKEDARMTVGMCTHGHIAEWEEHAGAFAGWSKQQRHDFMLLHYTAINAKWDALPPSHRDWWEEHAAIVKAQWREALGAFA